MKLKAVSGIMLTLLFTGMLTLIFNIQPVKASGTIYINADGSIVPSTANVTSLDNITYTFTDNINDSIVVYRNNIVVDGAGYTLQGSVNITGPGIDLSGRSNVTIKNMEIKAFGVGIYLQDSTNNRMFGNTITNNNYGIYLYESSNNNITGNDITNNELYGIVFDYSSNNTIHACTTANNGEAGTWVNESANNSIYHNNFLDVVYLSLQSCLDINFWDDGYPSGGNYWSGYTGVDLYSDPNQDEAGSDGIGDTRYVIVINNCTHVRARTDRYPLMGPFGPSTTEGENTTVFPTDDVGLIFENVTTGGSTTVNKTETGPDPPSGFRLAEQYYIIETTANFSGKIKIRIIYDDSGMTQEEEEGLKLFQWNETLLQWINITTYVDTENNIIYGEISHLSKFVILQPIIPPVGGIYIPVNKLELLAPYIGLTILLAVAVITVAYVKKRKRNKEIISITNNQRTS